MKVSFFTKVSRFFLYRRIIKANKEVLSNPTVALRRDWINRLYTVLNLDSDVKQYGVELTQTYIKKYLSDSEKVFTNIGLKELVGIYDIQKIDETNYLIVFGYSLFNTKKVTNRFLILTGISIISLFIFLLVK